MTLIAVTDVNHGKDGEVHYFEPGDEIDQSLFTAEQLNRLKEVGAVEESQALEEVANLRATVAALEAKLAQVESARAVASNQVKGVAVTPNKPAPAPAPAATKPAAQTPSAK